MYNNQVILIAKKFIRVMMPIAAAEKFSSQAKQK